MARFLPCGLVLIHMKRALGDIQFLANSTNRVRILDTLATEPATRRELQDSTGIPRSTTARVLDEAEDRGWVASEGSHYEITPMGEAMVSEFSAYIETTKGLQHLGRAIDWLPKPAHTLDFRCFRDAEITTPTEDNPTAAFDRAMELIRSANEYRGLTQNSLPEYMKTICDRVVSGHLDFQGVIEASFIEALRNDPDRAARWHDIAHGMWLYDGHVPINMHIVDGTALIWLCAKNESGEEVVIKGVLESEHPAVVSWAESLYNEYQTEAEPLDPKVLPEA